MSLRKAFLPAVTILVTGACGSGLLLARALPQQEQSTPSVADAARKARVDQKKDQNKQAKVFTNDDLAKLTGPISIVGIAPEPEAKPAAATAAPGAKPAAVPAEQGEAYWRKQFAAARKTLADDAKELDVLQREFNLKQQQYYSDPNVALREQYGRKDLDDTQTQINAKKQDVDKDTQAISDLQDELQKAGGDPGWSRDSQP